MRKRKRRHKSWIVPGARCLVSLKPTERAVGQEKEKTEDGEKDAEKPAEAPKLSNIIDVWVCRITACKRLQTSFSMMRRLFSHDSMSDVRLNSNSIAQSHCLWSTFTWHLVTGRARGDEDRCRNSDIDINILRNFKICS